MATIQEMYDRVNSINAEALVVDSIVDTQEELIAVNQEQLLDGLDKFGNKTKPLDWQSYKEDKRQNLGGSMFRNRDFDHYTMNYTGSLFRGMSLIVRGYEVSVISTAEQFNYYNGRFPELFGFNPNSGAMDFYRENHLYPRIVTNLKNILQL